ncbi:MAG: 50S ribosomal protein L23 [Candidatus Woesearchaeota archaeon]
MKHALDIIKYPIATEKAIRIMDIENKLMFIVQKKATKSEIKKAVEEIFKVVVKKVNTAVLPNGKKKAYVSLAPETPARDVATQLGLL